MYTNVPRVIKFIETESRMMFVRGWRGRRDEDILLRGYRVSVGKDEKNVRDA